LQLTWLAYKIFNVEGTNFPLWTVQRYSFNDSSITGDLPPSTTPAFFKHLKNVACFHSRFIPINFQLTVFA
jgi:hypothetical protein